MNNLKILTFELAETKGFPKEHRDIPTLQFWLADNYYTQIKCYFELKEENPIYDKLNLHPPLVLNTFSNYGYEVMKRIDGYWESHEIKLVGMDHCLEIILLMGLKYVLEGLP